MTFVFLLDSFGVVRRYNMSIFGHTNVLCTPEHISISEQSRNPKPELPQIIQTTCVTKYFLFETQIRRLFNHQIIF